MIDQWRADRSRRARESFAAAQAGADVDVPDQDDTLVLLFLCCHPALSPASAIPLTLRAVGGLTTPEIARAFLLPEPTMAQRISRAKRRIKASGVPFRMPASDEQADRLRTVLHVLYLIFNEGYTSSSGDELHRTELSDEAVRLTRMLHRLVPDDPEVGGLLALMLLIDARRPARTDAEGEIVPLPEQDRSFWDRALIAEGVSLLNEALALGAAGEYQLQAAIAALHDRAPRADDTDWPQILALYERLEEMTGSPVVRLNRAIAAAMVHGPSAALALLDDVEDRLADQHRLDAVRAHLLEMAGETDAAVAHYRSAAKLTTSLPERRYLAARAARLRQSGRAARA
jgi:predicted RNA polymerase sigma factor